MNTTTIPTWRLQDRLARALDIHDVGVQEMADHLGVARNTVSNYLHGRTTPSRSVLRDWALRCGVPFTWLTGDDEGPTTPAAGRRESGHTQEIITSRCTELSAA